MIPAWESNVKPGQKEINTMLDQMQASTIQRVVGPIPFPETLHFGRVTLINDFQMFLEAIECAIDAHMQMGSAITTMSARELLTFLKYELDTIDDEVPRYWHIGSLVGEIIGFLYPTLSTRNPSRTYLESLSHKSQKLSHQ
jgi:hypothetical protein